MYSIFVTFISVQNRPSLSKHVVRLAQFVTVTFSKVWKKFGRPPKKRKEKKREEQRRREEAL